MGATAPSLLFPKVTTMPCITLTRVANGFKVECQDPKIAADNDKSGPATNYISPYREYVFTEKEGGLSGALAFIESIAEKALPEEKKDPDPFQAAFNKAASSKETE